MRIYIITISVLSLFMQQANSQILDKSWGRVVMQSSDEWLLTDEAHRVAENVLLYQRDIGGWPKNIQMHKPLSEKEIIDLQKLKKKPKGSTIDNGATCLEMYFLCRMFNATKKKEYLNGFLKGVDYLLKSQYENGGWPQFYPLKKGYYTHITYNDNAMVNVMNLLRDFYENKCFPEGTEIPDSLMNQAKEAFKKGVNCIVKTQYNQKGVLTVWCAQHDEFILMPAKARAYELPSLSGKESAKIVLLLMSLEKPSGEVVRAVDAAVQWFKKTKITGLKEVRTYNEKGKLEEKVMVKDSLAKPIWARFMELDDNKPFFCGRDGVKKDSYQEIEKERRVGYAWYTNEPKEVLKKYPKWKKQLAETKKSNKAKGYKTKYIVSKDGTGDYVTIQEAINNAKAFPDKRITIFIKDGIYKEKIKVHEWNTNLSLIGESKEKTIITWDDYFNKMGMGRNSTFYTPTLYVEADDFVAKNLTIENSAGEVGQAVALSVFANRALIENCNLLGNQDTLYASGDSAKQYYKNCYIEGTTDFMFGRATAYFENCIIHSKKNSYITAASTSKSSEFGFVFYNCKLTADKEVTEVYLGRPWRKHAKTVFLNCEMGKHILPEGWHNWSKPEAEKTSFYAEYNSSGKGGDNKDRVKWSHQLTKKQVKDYSLENILGIGDWSTIE